MDTNERFPRRAARIRAGKSLVQAAAAAGTTPTTATKFECGGEEVTAPRQRSALRAVYDGFAAVAAAEVKP